MRSTTMNRKWMLLWVTALLLPALLIPRVVSAHQPYCETADLTESTPWQAPDSEISYAYYGNLYPEDDVDYFTFDATAGQSVLLSMSIPAIDGQEDFVPVMALFGPGIDSEAPEAMPSRVAVPAGQGGKMVDVGDKGEYWYEPFGGRYYWNFENTFFEAPKDGTYTVAMWHPQERLGRYSFVVGEREVFGGDRECMAMFDDYWTPLVAGENPYRDGTVEADAMGAMPMTDGDMTDGIMQADAMQETASHVHADGMAHDHGDPIEVSGQYAPMVDLQVIPLDDGGYNVRVQTMNFIFAPQNVGKQIVEGEGHAHLYIDDEKVARIYGEWYHLESLPEGAERISVSLYANNHQPLVVDAEPISDSVMVADLLSAAE